MCDATAMVTVKGTDVCGSPLVFGTAVPWPPRVCLGGARKAVTQKVVRSMDAMSA